MDSALLEKARKAKSKEELMALAKENSILLTEQDAEEYMNLVKGTSNQGELEDDELDNVSGGGCQTTVNGKKYVVVSSGCKCFTGEYDEIPDYAYHGY